MRSLHRATLNVALTLASMAGTGCVSLAPQNLRAQAVTRKELKMNAARLEESRGNLAQAKRLYLEIHQQDLSNGSCSHRLALICTQLKQHSEAEVYYRQAYASNANNPELLADMGYSAFLRKDYEQSERLLEQSIRLNSNDRRAITNLAIVRAWRGQDDSSLATFQCVNSDAEARHNLAAIQIARSDKDRGLRSHELAQAVDADRRMTTSVIAEAKSTEISATSYELPNPSPTPTPTLPDQAQDTVPPAPLALTGPTSSSCSDLSSDTVIELPTGGAFLPSESMLEIHGTGEIPVAPMPSLPVSVNANPIRSENAWIPVPKEESESVPNPPDSAVQSGLVVESTPVIVFETPTIASPPSARNDRRSDWRKTLSACGNTDPLTEKTDFKAVCLVTLFEEKRLANILPQFTSVFESQQYGFSSAEALEKFRVDPTQYAPVAGGLDVVSVRNERSAAQGSLDFALWYRRRIYLFSSLEHFEAFRREPKNFVTAD